MNFWRSILWHEHSETPFEWTSEMIIISYIEIYSICIRVIIFTRYDNILFQQTCTTHLIWINFNIKRFIMPIWVWACVCECVCVCCSGVVHHQHEIRVFLHMHLYIWYCLAGKFVLSKMLPRAIQTRRWLWIHHHHIPQHRVHHHCRSMLKTKPRERLLYSHYAHRARHIYAMYEIVIYVCGVSRRVPA